MTTRTIALVTTGGTIASTIGSDGTVAPSIRGDDFLHGVSNGVTLRLHDLMSVDSAAMSFAEMDLIRETICAALEDDTIDAVVVLHGTDTMEETALLVDLQHSDPRPVVFTGAQRSADHPETDGPSNLAAAIDCALDPTSRDRGVLISFGGRAMPARGARKVHTTALAAFSGPASADTRPTLPARPVAGTRVDIAALYPGSDRTAIDAFVAAGAHGLVLEAMGSGNANRAIVEAVRDAVAAGVSVVLSTRVHDGAAAAIYGGGGGGSDLTAAGAVVSPDLRPSQARILLAALLAGNADRQVIREWFSGG